jgi:hypothetical protein
VRLCDAAIKLGLSWRNGRAGSLASESEIDLAESILFSQLIDIL